MKAKDVMPNYREMNRYGCCSDCANVNGHQDQAGRLRFKCNERTVGAYMVCDLFDDGVPEPVRELIEELRKEATTDKPYVSFGEYQERLQAKMSKIAEA